MANLAGRLAAKRVQEATGKTVQPVASAVRGAIKPSMPSLPDLKAIIDAKDKRAQESRIGVEGYTHVSTLTQGICSRHYAIAALWDKKELEAVTGGHRLMWKYGRVAEAHIREQVTTGETFGLTVYGDWRCRCEKTQHIGAKPKPGVKTCKVCGTDPNVYYEKPFWDHENKIVGNPDLGCFVGRFFFVVEIKSMSKNLWDALEAPLADHVAQAITYRYLASLTGLTVHDKVQIIYAVKEFKWGSPYKVYEIDATTVPYQRMLSHLLEQAVVIRDALATKVVPPRLNICTDPDARRAKGCNVCATCWNLPA